MVNSLSSVFPAEPFARAVANAITAIICEQIPALEGINLKTAIGTDYAARMPEILGQNATSTAGMLLSNLLTSTDTARISRFNLSSESLDQFQNGLCAGILSHIREHGEKFGCLKLYLRDSAETEPKWLLDLIEELADKQNFPLHSLMPYRKKLAFAVQDDGEVFWGESSYGPATADIRIEDYLGKPAISGRYVHPRDLFPDFVSKNGNVLNPEGGPATGYCIDAGLYVPIFEKTKSIDDFSLEFRIKYLIENFLQSTEKVHQGPKKSEHLINLYTSYLDRLRSQGYSVGELLGTVTLIPKVLWDAQGFTNDNIMDVYNSTGRYQDIRDLIRNDKDRNILHMVSHDTFVRLDLIYDGRSPFLDAQTGFTFDARGDQFTFYYEGDFVRGLVSPLKLMQAQDLIRAGYGHSYITVNPHDWITIRRCDEYFLTFVRPEAVPLIREMRFSPNNGITLGNYVSGANSHSKPAWPENKP